ncbi:MAG: tyrosine-type recombinase/integrase [Verrucomicrobiales bacterium]
MKQRYRVFRRGWGTYYCEDLITRKQESLKTRDKHEAFRLVAARNETEEAPAFSLHLARVYWKAGDPAAAKRTWQQVMDEIPKLKEGPTQERWFAAIADKAFQTIREVVVLETRVEQFLKVLEKGTVSTHVYLRRIHNFALSMGWLPWPLLNPRQWPKIRHRERRGITLEEHSRIIAREGNSQWRAFYQMCWHLGGSQTDMANLIADDIDWDEQIVSYRRRKTGTAVHCRFGEEVTEILRGLPSTGRLFPRIAELHEKHRAKLFRRRCLGLGMDDISLHCYRYAWAERAKRAGYPERFAQEALGHNSVAIHRAYAKKALVTLPSLEEYERKIVRLDKDLERLSPGVLPEKTIPTEIGKCLNTST